MEHHSPWCIEVKIETWAWLAIGIDQLGTEICRVLIQVGSLFGSLSTPASVSWYWVWNAKISQISLWWVWNVMLLWIVKRKREICRGFGELCFPDNKCCFFLFSACPQRCISLSTSCHIGKHKAGWDNCITWMEASRCLPGHLLGCMEN